jgi:type II secretory pathway pseudopilin PulG
VVCRHVSRNAQRLHSGAGFTLLEVVLAIGLCGAVMALLTTAIDLYLVRVDTSRTQVETAQLARALLNQIADDLRAVRYSTPSLSVSSSPGGTGGQTSGGSGTGTGSGSSSTALETGVAPDLGIYGTLTELRIARAASRSWRQITVPSTQLLTDSDPQDMPQTVEYFFVEGRVMPSVQFAAGGVTADTPLEGYTGLYRRQTPTAAMTAPATGFTSNDTSGPADLLAPEVVQVAFLYSDGTQWYEQWDSSTQQALPVAVEIKVSLFSDVFSDKPAERALDEEARRRDPTRWVEHRLLVRIPQLDEPQQLGGSSSAGRQQQGQGGQPNAT